ncbi:molybdopterin-dependent oxidoreductase [Hymenobacter yonginensis]|uniref:Molybdopterin-dependent oxidoreductase n=1 Tax=Hymenobacter yonginensis TaxID=748197 RepID=A0ABY7PHL7_9BACT|nr:molybdopterin-dependent oxidoreductase [Hymenobacter yonginensis]WBO82918.1 molybdopterin-dependent oxidoreductase [Hymenobacter yonginensis]
MQSESSLPQPPATPPVAADVALEREVTRRSRRAFLVGGLAALAGLGGWRWLLGQPEVMGIPGPLRAGLEANARVAATLLSPTQLAPEFPRSQARTPRANGSVGLKQPLDTAAWRLRVEGFGGQPAREFSLAELQALPRTEMTTELKCIEGWSTVVTWAGVRLTDFLARYPLATLPSAEIAPYVSLRTPDEAYYVGLDMASALHPQTLLCYEMNGRPLLPEHGAPLRLITPRKYGIKQLKRIGTLAFVAERPADYWAARGYDWHASL